MGKTFLEFMKEIGIFIICAQSLIHFVAGKKYEKYMKVLIGMMILAQFVAPVRDILSDGSAQMMWTEIERFQTQMEEAMGEAESMAGEMDFAAGEEQLKSLAEEQMKEEEETEEKKEIKIKKIEINGR